MSYPTDLRCGDYVMNFPVERAGDRQTAREAMKRNGCRAIRFECNEVTLTIDRKEVQGKNLVAHGYVARIEGNEVEAL